MKKEELQLRKYFIDKLKQYNVLRQEEQLINVTNKSTGQTYEITKSHYQKNKNKYIIPKRILKKQEKIQ